MIEALMFDFDGLIVDTEWQLYETWQSVFAQYGAELTVADFVTCIGTRGAIDWGELLASRTGDAQSPSSAALRAQSQPIQLERVGTLPLLPGIASWLEAAQRAQMPCSVASSSERWWIEPHLQRLGIADHFVAMTTWELDCGYPPKPAPHIYERACGAVGVAPRAAIALEDSPNGVAAAKAAGLFCIAVPNRLTEGLDFRAADVVVPSLAEFALADALALAS